MMMSENGVSIPQLTILFGELDDSASNFGGPCFQTSPYINILCSLGRKGNSIRIMQMKIQYINGVKPSYSSDGKMRNQLTFGYNMCYIDKNQ